MPGPRPFDPPAPLRHAALPCLGALLLAACAPTDGADPPLTPSVQDTSPSADTGTGEPLDTGPDMLVWPGDGPCVPACGFAKRCESGACVHRDCTEDAQCNPAGGVPPGEPPWFCYHGKCQAYQCGVDEDCPVGQVCNKQTSRCQALRTGCAGHASCDDGDPCTADTCDPASGQCAHEVVANCCQSAADCKPPSKCIVATCQTGKCVFAGVDGCCTVAAECYDGDACTLDTCAGGKCAFTPQPGCCKADGACDDDDPLSADICHDKTCIHTWAGLPATCKDGAGCQGNACLKGSCVSGACTYAKTSAKGCCDAHAACATTKACTLGKCVARQCVEQPVAGVGAHVSWGFDSTALDGWTVIKGNAVSYFHFHSGDKVAGAGSMRYGVPGKISIGTGAGNHGSATSPWVKLPAKSPALRFEVYFDGNPISSVQRFGLEVLAGGKSTEVWEKTKDLGGSTQQQWKTQDVSLAAWAGQKVRLRVYFDMKFATNKEDKKGLLIDAMEVRGACP